MALYLILGSTRVVRGRSCLSLKDCINFFLLKVESLLCVGIGSTRVAIKFIYGSQLKVTNYLL